MDIVFNDDASVAYSERTGTAYRLSMAGAGEQKPTTSVQDSSQRVGDGNVEYWGDDNLFPQTVYAQAKKNTIIPRVIEQKSLMLYQGGIEYGIEDLDTEGNVRFKRIKDGVIQQFIQRTRINRYALEATLDFYWFYNCFPEMVVTKDRKQIIALSTQEASYCRWGKQNDKSGLLDTCYINANWETVNSQNKQVTKVGVVDPYYDPVTAMREGSAYKYIYPVSFPSPGKSFYQLAAWNSIRESGWLDIATSVPAFKKALFKNQISVKYLIEVATWWWEWKYPGFNQLPANDRRKIMSDELQRFETFMAGDEKAGNSLMVTFKSNPDRGEEYKGWKITPVDNKFKDGMYIEDSQETSSHLLFALDVDPTLIGFAPGKGMGAGSGSDKQAAFNTYLSRVQAHADLILEPLHFIRDYNGWNPDIRFRFKREILMPQTSGKPKLSPVDNNQ